MVSCSACGERNPDGFRFCGSCGSPLEDQGAVGREVRKTVTVVFCDLAGSTALGERLDPESLQRVLGRYYQRMREVLERHEGTVAKFIGDAVVGVFGIPRLHEDDALRAARAAVELRTALADLNEELERDWGVTLQIRVGVNTGEVVAGSPAVGSALVLGDAVNVAARLEQAAAPDEVLLGRTTWRLVRDAVQVEPVTPLAVKGKADRVVAWRLQAVTSDRRGHSRRREVPMVGRELERRRLLEMFDRVVAERACRLVTVLGTAGVGKTRLVEEALASVGGQATVLRGRCLSYGEGITYWPVAEVVHEAAGIADDDADSDDPRTRIASLVSGEERADRIVNGVAHAIGLPGAQAAPDETFWSIRRFLEAIARRGPLVACFEDIHWAEPTLLDLIEHIAAWSRDAPILLVCAAREELLDRRPAWGGGEPADATIHLEPLSEPAGQELVDRLLGQAEFPLELRRRIAEAADGNPLFAEEFVSMLLEEGSLRRHDGEWKATAYRLEMSVPASIQALLAARLDQLDGPERIVGERASVEGMVFHRGAVLELCGGALREALDPQLGSLLRRELILPDRAIFAGDEAFRFRHLLIREAAYQAMPKQLRAQLHERFADWLERTAGDRIQEHEEILAYHLERAYQYRVELAPPRTHEQELARRATQRLAAAAGRATARIDLTAAANLLGRATTLATRDEPIYPQLLWELGVTLNRLGDDARAERVLSEVVELAPTSGDARLAPRARLDLLFARLHTGATGVIERIPVEVRALVSALEDLGDDLGLTKAWQLLAARHWLVCEFEASRQPLDRALLYARRAGDRLEEGGVLAALVWACRWGPTPVEDGIRRCEQVAGEVRGDRRIEAEVLATQGVLLAMLGRFQEARMQLGRTGEIYKDLGLLYGLGLTSEARLEIEMLAGDPVEAERAARAVYEEYRDEHNWMSDRAASALALALCAQERYEEATSYTDITGTPLGDQVMDQIMWRIARSRALAGLGWLDEAARIAREAVTLAGTTDALNLHGDALMALAEVLRAAGRPDHAAAAVQQALDRYARKGNLVSARAAESLLGP
jgi:class 3 adenylate cyclase/tetratricopeptide (TPR) repeat protein